LKKAVKMKKMMWYLAAVFCMVLMQTGCVDVEYIGQNFPPLPDTGSVMIFQAGDDIPAGEFQVIGKLKMNVPPGIDMVEVREKLAEEALKHGASAVRIVSIEKKLVNRYYGAERQESLSPMLVGRSAIGGRATQADGSSVEVNSFGQVVEPNRTYHERYEHVVKAQLMMPAKDYARAVELRRAAADKDEQ
jgi:hypothetical protein